MGEFTRKSIKELFSQQPGSEVIVKGWVRTKRGNKNVSFIALNDGSTIRNMQIVCDGQKFSEELMKDITTGACLCVKGKLVESMGKGQSVEVQADAIEEGTFHGIPSRNRSHENEDQHLRMRDENP